MIVAQLGTLFTYLNAFDRTVDTVFTPDTVLFVCRISAIRLSSAVAAGCATAGRCSTSGRFSSKFVTTPSSPSLAGSATFVGRRDSLYPLFVLVGRMEDIELLGELADVGVDNEPWASREASSSKNPVDSSCNISFNVENAAVAS